MTYSAGRLALEDDVRLLFVEPYADGVELDFEESPLLFGLCGVEHDQDYVGRLRRRDHLSPSTASLAGTFNDTGQIQQLDPCALVFDDSWNSLVRVC